MLNMPILKFEKSTNYLNEQLDIQSNNKHLVSDIISNIGLFLAQVSEEDYPTYLSIQESANIFLQTISENITVIEELSREIKHITSDLTDVLSEASRKEKSKEYYIAAISSVKNNIENYTSKFQNFEQKLEKDNSDFNEFININNIQYNFVSDKNTDSYEFSGFTIDDKTMENPTTETEEIEITETIEEAEVNKKDAKIDELTNEFKNMLSGLSEDAVLSLDLITSLKEEFKLAENSKIEEPTDEITAEVEEEIELKKAESSTEEIEDSIEDTQEDSNENIIIDYSSIYGDYYKNASTIEENIFSEYSTFTPSSNKNFETLFVLQEDDEPEVLEEEKIEITDEDLLEELLKEDLETEAVAEEIVQTEETVEEEILDSISDDDLLAELLISDTDILSEEPEQIVSEPIVENTSSTPIEEVEPTVQEVVQEKAKPIKINYNNFSNFNLEEKVKIIKEATSDNDSLIISEKQDKIFLPYTIDELEKYLKSYPDVYTSLVDVVNQEFILPFNSFLKHPAKARFVETYNLIKNRQGNSIFSAIAYAIKLVGRYNLNPAIIAACKNETQLDTYLYYLNSNSVEEFKNFKIIYEINPL